MNLIQQILSNPSATVSLLTAVIAASVALVVFALTQYFTKKREQTRFLSPKLEELYLLLNEFAENNVTFFKMSYACSGGNQEACNQLGDIDELVLYGDRRSKKIIMYVRLYFPKLSTIHQSFFRAQSEIIAASGEVSHFLRLMEKELIDNRDVLLEDHVILKRYKASSKRELENIPPPPEGPAMSSHNKANPADEPKARSAD
jgi:hypothetical protein